jgi:hypothetical protein
VSAESVNPDAQPSSLSSYLHPHHSAYIIAPITPTTTTPIPTSTLPAFPVASGRLVVDTTADGVTTGVTTLPVVPLSVAVDVTRALVAFPAVIAAFALKNPSTLFPMSS